MSVSYSFPTLEKPRAVREGQAVFSTALREEELQCLVVLRPGDGPSGIEFRDCLVDYTTCPNRNCIKKLI
ncbi:MAG: hypothetical protein H7A21_04535 [Spirochaetales bacterium]|nr:hypothetical protein [Leptospiraceae bacterium]MCP5480681.1 hypothetical protein [Spirochaetales bacterium]MCP5484033.1 hypothetical protein [Spirochaetales bacterium]